MTATLAAPADRGLLAALAIAFDEAGVRDRADRLALSSIFARRPLRSSAELTADEARELRRMLRRDGQVAVAALQGFADARELDAERAATATSTCACVDGGRPGQSSQCDPAGVGRYCPPSVCWCGHCPWWTPAPAPNYAAAIAKLAEAGAR